MLGEQIYPGFVRLGQFKIEVSCRLLHPLPVIPDERSAFAFQNLHHLVYVLSVSVRRHLAGAAGQTFAYLGIQTGTELALLHSVGGDLQRAGTYGIKRSDEVKQLAGVID